MKTLTAFISLALLGLSAPSASAQFGGVVTAPRLEATETTNGILIGQSRALSDLINQSVDAGVKEQELTKVFSEKNMLLAKEWYDGLLQISSAVQSYRRVQSIFQKQLAIGEAYIKAITTLKKSAFLTPDQLSDMGKIYMALLEKSINTAKDLRLIISPAMLKATDAERIQFINKLEAETDQLLSLINYFNQRNLALMHMAEQRAQDALSLKAFMDGK